MLAAMFPPALGGRAVTMRHRAPARIGETTHRLSSRHGGFHPRGQELRPTIWCSKANAVAAARVETPILVKMFERCRSIVFSLNPRASAICLFVLPDATRQRTSPSRSVTRLG